MVAPSMRWSAVRYGCTRSTHQLPSWSLTSRCHGCTVAITASITVPMPSTTSDDLMCSIDRPTSVGSRLNAVSAAGVRRRMHRSRPTVTIGRSALVMKFDRSSVRASSSRLRAWNCSLTVVSSSLADCSSSLVVSSSSLVLCSSSLLESTSSCAARSSWVEASR